MDEFSATLRHLFTPHHTNNHRPRIVHPEMLFGMIGLLFTLHIAIRVTSHSYPLILGYATNISIEDLLLLTNQERLNEGLGSLSLNPILSRAAEKKALDMFEDDYWAHVAPDGATPWDFIVAEGYSYTYAGENLARDFSNSDGVVQAWMNSPAHRENLMRGNYTEIGFAVVNGTLNGEETTLVVQMFGTPQSRMAAVSDAPVVDIAEEALVAPQPDVPVAVSEEVAGAGYEMPASSVKKPVIDQTLLQKNISLLLLGGLITVFLIDAFMIWRRKTVRIAGHNFAHVIFIASLIAIVLISTRGSVLAGTP